MATWTRSFSADLIGSANTSLTGPADLDTDTAPGDFDPSGEDIRRDFIDRTDCWDEVVRVALSREQVTEYNLPPQPGKRSDSRAAKFEARHGRLVQVEVDALPPDTLRNLFNRVVMTYLDKSILDEVMRFEVEDRGALEKALAVI